VADPIMSSLSNIYLILSLWSSCHRFIRQRDTEATLKCPITTMLLVEPMKSKVCKHVFSKAAIFEVIRKSANQGTVKCPNFGRYYTSVELVTTR